MLTCSEELSEKGETVSCSYCNSLPAPQTEFKTPPHTHTPGKPARGKQHPPKQFSPQLS